MLSGVNKICAKCINSCKQWKQVKVVVCPQFEAKDSKEDAKFSK